MSQNGHASKPKKKKKKRTNKIKSQNRAHRKTSTTTTNNALSAPSNGYSSSTHKSSTSPKASVNGSGSQHSRSKRATSNPRQFRHKFNMTEMQLVIGQIGEMKKSWKTPAEEVIGRIYEIMIWMNDHI